MYQQLKAFVTTYIQLTNAEWLDVQPYFKPIAIQKGDYLIHEGQTSQYLYFVNAGLLRLFYLQNGEETTRYLATEGDFAGALSSFLTRKPTLENMQALENCELLQLHYDDLQTLYKKYSAWHEFSRKLLEEAYIEQTSRIESLICQSAEARYKNFIQYEYDLFQRVPQQYIATYLGIQPETLSRIRRKFAQSTS